MNITPQDRNNADALLRFMQRATLTGAEVSAYVALATWLHNIANAPQADIEAATVEGNGK
jgi:hypothetical protein